MRRRLGLWIAIAALLVNAPRLVQAFLEADGLQLSEPLRPLLMGTTGVAAAITLTGGGAWLAHELARGGERLQGLLLSCWLLVLAGQLLLIPPMLMTEMGESRLGAVLGARWLQWSWAFVAVLLVEVVAAGAMVAQGRRNTWAEERALERAELERLALERNAAVAELRRLASGSHGEGNSLPDGQRNRVPDGPRDPLPDGQRNRVPRRRRGPVAKRQRNRVAGADAAATDAARFPCRRGCGWVGRSQPSENGHQRFCPLRETVDES